MSRRSFLEAAAWLATAGSLAGCSSDGTAGVARGSAPGTVTADTPIYDVINNPLLDGYGRLLFPTTLHPPAEDMTLDDLSACLPWYSEIHTSTTVDIVSYLLSERAAERTVFYDIYTDAEKAAPRSPTRGSSASLPSERRVCTVCRGKRGRRIRLRRCHARLLPALPAPVPFRYQRVRGHLPAGRAARLRGLGPRHLLHLRARRRAQRGHVGLFAVGRLEALSATGVPTEFHVYEGLRHGFGLGIGTVAEGWIDDAIAFWEAQR